MISEDSTTDEQFGGSLTIQENAEAADCEFAENLSDIVEAINCINFLFFLGQCTNCQCYSASLKLVVYVNTWRR